jgi:hypothetical protein
VRALLDARLLSRSFDEFRERYGPAPRPGDPERKLRVTPAKGAPFGVDIADVGPLKIGFFVDSARR